MVVALAAMVSTLAHAAALRYVFSEGEPLDYCLTITGQIDSHLTREMGHGPQREQHRQQLELTVYCRFVPIVVTNDEAKVRLVIDRIHQQLTDDGDVIVATLSRAGLKRVHDGQVTEQTYFDV